jgi:hypothetical protein
MGVVRWASVSRPPCELGGHVGAPHARSRIRTTVARSRGPSVRP